MLIPDGDFEPSINNLDVTDTEENKELYQKISTSKKPEHLEHYDTNFEIVRYGDKYVMLNHIRQTIDYYVKVEEGSYKILGKWQCQVEVWRDDESPMSLIVPYMFEKYILPKYQTVISDSVQTDKGRKLWIRLVYKMMNQGNNVYVYDRNNNDLIHVADQVHFQSLMSDVYGESKKFQHIRLVVSKNDLH